MITRIPFSSRLSIGRLALVGSALFAVPAILNAAQPSGSSMDDPPFTAEQAAAGRLVYDENCSVCHGAQMQGLSGPAIAGSHFVDLWANGRKTVDDLLFIIRDMMPLQAPGTLTGAQYLNVVAYILAQNGYKPGSVALDEVSGKVLLAPPPGAAIADKPQENKTLGLLTTPEKVGTATTSLPVDAELLAPGNSVWLMYNKSLDAQRYSELDQIHTGNAAQLVPTCLFQVGEIGSFQSSPVVYDGIMYVTTGYNTYAIDAQSCRKLWEHNYTPVDNSTPVVLSRGVAIYRGKLFRVTPNGHVLAIDAKTGALLWDVWTSDKSKGYWLSGAPVAFDGKVFVGEAGADWGANGHIRAFDTETGKLVWTFNLIPQGKEFGADTWGKGSETGGGSWWSSFAIDPARKLLYFSVGNPAPDYFGAMRPGDNLFTNSVVAVDYRTGKRVWHAQQVPHDVHDWDTAASPTLYSLNGKNYMSVGNKGGWVYIYDSDKAKIVATTEVSPHENVDVPLTPEGVRHCPGLNGGVMWNGTAFSPKSGQIYVNSVHWCGTTSLTEARYIEGSSYFGGRHVWDSVEMAKGFTRALDAATGKEIWVRESKTPMLAALTPTAGGLLFTGDLDGNFLTLDAKTGKELYSFNTGGGVAGAASTYMLGGRQYVAITSGNSSRSVWKTTGAATVVVFALPRQSIEGTAQ